MVNILVICDTLRQAVNLFNRFVALLPDNSRIQMYKNRLEIVILNAQSTRFTSKCHYEMYDKYGFAGTCIDGYEFEKKLDREERYNNAKIEHPFLNKEFHINEEVT